MGTERRSRVLTPEPRHAARNLTLLKHKTKFLKDTVQESYNGQSGRFKLQAGAELGQAQP